MHSPWLRLKQAKHLLKQAKHLGDDFLKRENLSLPVPLSFLFACVYDVAEDELARPSAEKFMIAFV